VQTATCAKLKRTPPPPPGLVASVAHLVIISLYLSIDGYSLPNWQSFPAHDPALPLAVCCLYLHNLPCDRYHLRKCHFCENAGSPLHTSTASTRVERYFSHRLYVLKFRIQVKIPPRVALGVPNSILRPHLGVQQCQRHPLLTTVPECWL
jgi:hypothetical protein